MNDETTLVQISTKITGFGRIPKFRSQQDLIDRLKFFEAFRQHCTEQIDARLGEELIAAKEALGHGHFLQALAADGMSERDARRHMEWSKTAQCADMDTAKAEQKLSLKAREEFCRADDDTKAIIALAVSDDETSKITAKQIKAVVSAPDNVRQAVISSNEPEIQEVRALINGNFEIDVSGHSKDELGELLVAHSSEINGLRMQCAGNDTALELGMKDFGSFNSEGYWYQHKPLTIIKNQLEKLSASERRELINLLTPTINV